ncbi:MAG: thiamine phosphate synthase [Pseudomonadota bacterium]
MTLSHKGYPMRAASLAAAARRLAEETEAKTGKRAPFDLIFMTDRKRAPNPQAVIRALNPAGNRRAAVIFRDYDAPHRARLARHLSALCKSRRVTFLVAGDAKLAAAVDADGVHWPAFKLATAKKTAGLITAACHNEAEIAAANRLGVDAVLLSPVFETASHPGAEAMAVDRLARLMRKTAVPVFALGGVDHNAVSHLKGRGFSGIAAIGAFNPYSS